jgi:putative selenate reductase FAD-binding subunit
MIEIFKKPDSAAQALELAQKNPEWKFIAGGTYLLTPQFSKEKLSLISIEGLVPTAISVEGTGHARYLSIGAGASFQDLLDSEIVPGHIKAACASMVDRNIRNRATLGGNIGADKSCASLVPLCIALGARYLCQDGSLIAAEEWHTSVRMSKSAIQAAKFLPATAPVPCPLVRSVHIPIAAFVLGAFERYSRTACDLSVLTCAISAVSSTQGIKPDSLRICIGGLGPWAERFLELEKTLAAAMDSRSLPSKEQIETIALGFFNPKSDARGSAEFKRIRAAALVADALHRLKPLFDMEALA